MQRQHLLLALVSFCLPVFSSGLEIETAYTRQYAAGEIRTLGNHLGQPLSKQGFRTVVASQPDNPDGQYFILHLEEIGQPPAVARMTLFTTISKDSTVYTWNIPTENLESWLYLGLTGSDWADEDARPLAWKIELLDSSGSLLTEWKSFLWEMP